MEIGEERSVVGVGGDGFKKRKRRRDERERERFRSATRRDETRNAKWKRDGVEKREKRLNEP